ncbi:MAG TPA: PEP-CTERM sorting domain-containing protein [Lacipirellulaceae bacterium]|jgi:hypothetical protein|nr:PEP-CTERM sorting domain-containing protein [Lacipirellulaceae bacterium]
MNRHLLVLFACVLFAAQSVVASAATLLTVDFNDRTAGTGGGVSNTQAGFSSWKMGGTTAASSALESQAVGAYNVTLQAFDDGLDENNVQTGIQNTTGQIDDRLRTTPANAGALTFADLYDDVIFAGASTGPTGGLDMTVSGGSLQPNTQYLVSVYAFDSGSTPAPQPRTANWLDGNNADALVAATSFNGTVLPTANDTYKFTGIAITDATGKLLLHARDTTPYTTPGGGATVGVVVNGFEVAEVPEPASVALFVAGAAILNFVGRRKHRPYVTN